MLALKPISKLVRESILDSPDSAVLQTNAAVSVR